MAFIFREDKTDHLRDKELFTTTKLQKLVKLTIGNYQLNNWDIGMKNETCESFQYQHTTVENNCQRYHRLYLKDYERIDILQLLGPKPAYAYIVLPHRVRPTRGCNTSYQ